MRRFLLLLCTTLFCPSLWAGVKSIYISTEPEKVDNLQRIYYSETNRIPFLVPEQHRLKNRSLYLEPNLQTFVRDAEYFLPYTEGYSALGFFLKPTLTYNHDQTLKASVGVHMMGIAGDHIGIRGISPIVTLQYQPAQWITIIGGTLNGNLSHNLYEPMYDFDRYFYANKEDGLQVFAHTKHWNSEMWCNWEDFIIPGSDWQEKFTFGWTNTFHIKPFNDKRSEFQIPLHLMMNHRGGQFTSLKDTCIETLANVAAAIRYVGVLNPKLQMTADLPIFGFFNRSNEEHIHTHFKDGWGIYPQIAFHNTHPVHNWMANVGYWYGDGFISGRGSYLFQSRSYFDPDFERRYRHMLTVKASYCLNRIFGFEFQAYYDMDEPGVDYSAGIYLLFDKYFKLKTWKK